MARIFKRGKTWSYTVELPTPTGERKRKTKGGFKTQREAKESAALLEAEICKGEYINENDILLEDYIRLFLDNYSKKVKHTTLNSSLPIYKHFARYFFKYRLKDITSLAYQKYIDDLEISLGSIRHYNSKIRLLFASAVKKGLLRNDPTKFVELPKETRTIEDKIEEKYLTLEELQKFLECAKSTDFYVAFNLLAYTGIRLGELTALKWSDLEGNVLHINKNISITKSTKDFIITTTKTKSSTRDIVISDVVVKLLKQHKKEQTYLKLASKVWLDEDFIFTSKLYEGYPLFDGTFRLALKKVLNKAGITKHITLHSFRHTHCSLLAQAGASLESIQERLGHSSCEITRKIYLHVTQDVKTDTMEKFDRLMGNK